MTGGREVELKLVLDEGSSDRLEGGELLAGTKARKGRLRSTYFDTHDRRLQRAGASLRVRRDGGRFLQTVKSSSGNALFDRGEWEHPLSGEAVDRNLLEGTPAGDLVDAKTELDALFTVDVERRSRIVRCDASEIEVAIDRGQISSDGSAASERVSEVELELKSGSPADLFKLARQLSAETPLRLGVRSKAERGYALLDGGPEGASKAQPVTLTKSMTAGEAFQAIARACLRHMRLNEDALLVRPEIESLHQLRVSLRRLRAAISIFGEMLADADAPQLRARLKETLAPFGRARNLDVIATKVLADERARHPDEPSLQDLERRVQAEREQAYREVDALLRSDAWRSTILDLVAWIETGPWLTADDAALRDRPVKAFARDELARRRRKISKRGRHLDRLTPHERHEVRIAAKKLRYGAEFFASLFPKEKAARRQGIFVKALAELQDQLGDLNDIATTYEILDGLRFQESGNAPTHYAAGLLVADAENRSEKLLRDARKAHKAFADAKRFWE